MNASLIQICSQLRKLFANAVRDDILTRHRIGETLRAVKHMPHTYGTQAIECVAAEIGMGAPLLYRYIGVAERWSADELKRLADRANRFGQPLTWSHFVILARVKEERHRQELLDASLNGRWSVRELQRRCDRDVAPPDEQPLSRARERDVEERFRQHLERGGRAASDVAAVAHAVDEYLGDGERSADDELLGQAIEALEDVRRRADDALARLRGARGSATRLRVSQRMTSSELIADDLIEAEAANQSTGEERQRSLSRA